MAKAESGKIRFIMFEVEGGNDTLAQGMQAMAHALSRVSAPSRVAAPTGAPALQGNGNGSHNGQLAMEMPYTEADCEVEVSPIVPPKKPTQPRKYHAPKVLDDVDLTSGDPSFEAFCAQKAPKSTVHRYLVIATWFKDHRDTPTIGQDHVYTCYRKMGWTILKDFGQPFRDASRPKTGYGTVKNGLFTINHIGLGVAAKMGGQP